MSRATFELPGRPSLRTAGQSLKEAFTPTVRLGVTGLSRAGKTVFITALVRNLMIGGRLPFFTPEAEGRVRECILEPQPDDAIPRFDYEAHLASLAADPPNWPDSTRRISELRLSLGFRPRDIIRRTLGLDRLHIDIVDYPGEWLIDLALLDQSYAVWSAEARRKAEAAHRASLSADWRAFADTAAAQPDAEQSAIEGSRKFTAYLAAAKASEHGVGALTPGRFLMPGDLAGSPLLTFFPLQATNTPLHRLLEKRFESYKREVVKPFFRNHFLKLDRQVVLVDVLGALSRGPESVTDLEEALTSVLSAFRPGTNTWLSNLYTRRIDRVLFAATKADHVSRLSHDRLEAILMTLTERAASRVTTAGGDVRVMALAALRATREAEVKRGAETLHCIAGIPMPGEVVAGKSFDGKREAVIFPGDLPADPQDALAHPGQTQHGHVMSGTAATFVRFRPPRLATPIGAHEPAPTPHIRLDRALDYLIGDWLP